MFFSFLPLLDFSDESQSTFSTDRKLKTNVFNKEVIHENLFHVIQNCTCHYYRSVFKHNNTKLSSREGKGGFTQAEHLPDMRVSLGSIPNTTEKERSTQSVSR